MEFRESIITVFNRIICPTGFECPDVSDFIVDLVYTLRDGEQKGNSIIMCCGSSGRGDFLIQDQAGFPLRYSITLENPPTPQGLVLVQDAFGCNGGILLPGDNRRCEFTNEYRVAPTP